MCCIFANFSIETFMICSSIMTIWINMVPYHGSPASIVCRINLSCVSIFTAVLIPLDQVAEEYRSKGQYFTHLKTVGVQFGIFRDVFGQSFHPKTFTTIRYGSQQVYQGNLLKASEVIM